jgi:hypothetical protein
MTYGQMPDNNRLGLSMNELIRVAESTASPEKFHLRSAVVNNNLVFQSHAFQDELENGPFVNEIIHYAIMEKTAISLDGNTLSRFSLSCSIRANFVFWTNPTDPISKAILVGSNKNEGSPDPGLLKGVKQNPVVVHPHKASMSFWDRAKHLASNIWKHRDSILSTIGKVAGIAGMILAPAVHKSYKIYPSLNYEKGLYAILRAIDVQGEYVLDDPDLQKDVRKIIAKIQLRIDHIRCLRTRLFLF